MKAPLFVSFLMLAIPATAPADEPVYDVANTAPAAGNNGVKKPLHVNILAGEHGWEHTGGRLVIGRSDTDIIVDVHGIHGGGPSDMTVRDSGKWDSVEIIFGAKKGSGQYYQAIISTDVDPATKAPRVVIHDFRKPEPVAKPAVKVEGKQEDGGYMISAHLPLADLAIDPKNGSEASLQVYVNQTDASGVRHTVSWHPERRVHTDPAAMYRIRLADQSSPEVQMAVRASLDQGRPRVDVYTIQHPSGLKIKSGDEVVAIGQFVELDGTVSQASVLVPDTATEVYNEQWGSMPIDFTNLHDLQTAGVLNFKLAFKPSVFSGEKFPPCDLDKDTAAQTEKALGKCTLTPVFYDADYNEVTKAARPGRYGAIVHVKTQGGLEFNRFVTLYRAPEELLGRILQVRFSGIALPPELGIDPAVTATRLKNVGALFSKQFRTWAGIDTGSDAAILLAWLAESKPGNAPDLQRTGPSMADQLWWYGLKKKTGNLRSDYFVHLPPDYEADPKKQWPLILFLHGSGERGYDVNLVTRTGLPQDIDQRKDFPFIVVAPQVSPGDWWSLPELKDLLAQVEKKYRVDASRIYLTGLSMGGYASWAFAADSPGLFAAVVPICGGGDPQDAARLKDLPIWVFHGGQDDAVPIERSQEMVDAIKKAGGNPKFTIFPDDGHNSWTDAYATPELYEWLLKQQKK